MPYFLIFFLFRNVVTGAHYHFVSRFTYSAAYIVAALVMLLFVSIDTKIINFNCIFFKTIMHISDSGHFNAAEILPTPNIRLYRGAASDARVQHGHLVSSCTNIDRHTRISG